MLRDGWEDEGTGKADGNVGHNSAASVPMENSVHLQAVSSQRQVQLLMLVYCHPWAKVPGVFALGLNMKATFIGSSG